MKKWLAAVLVLTVILGMAMSATAEAWMVDLGELSLEQLLELQSAVSEKIAEVKDEQIVEDAPIAEDSTLREIFPDVAFAKCVRDVLAKTSIDSPVTQEELDSIMGVSFHNADSFGVCNDLTGIAYLKNLETVYFFDGTYGASALPDELFLLPIKSLCVWGGALEDIPESIGCATTLIEITFGNTKVRALPDSVCQLLNLETLYLAASPIEKLPENIGDLKRLKYLDISWTQITNLPESIHNLSGLEQFKRAGLPLE